MYGLTSKQMEERKIENREEVVKSINHLAEQLRSGEMLTIEMITHLHEVNNHGIVPKRASKIRSKAWETVSFGKRDGVSPEKVEPAVEIVIAEINKILQARSKKNLFSNLMWAVNVAKFHNDFLDIHPFSDRNGSTSLLLVELLMAVEGDYKPAHIRETNYYKNLFNILKNPVAVAVVAYQHYKIAHTPGSYTNKFLP